MYFCLKWSNSFTIFLINFFFSNRVDSSRLQTAMGNTYAFCYIQSEWYHRAAQQIGDVRIRPEVPGPHDSTLKTYLYSLFTLSHHRLMSGFFVYRNTSGNSALPVLTLRCLFNLCIRMLFGNVWPKTIRSSKIPLWVNKKLNINTSYIGKKFRILHIL